MFEHAKRELLRKYRLEHGDAAADAFEKEHTHAFIGANIGLYTGAASGALLGSLIFPGVGTVVGGVVGGFLGLTNGAKDKTTTDNLKTAAKGALDIGSRSK